MTHQSRSWLVGIIGWDIALDATEFYSSVFCLGTDDPYFNWLISAFCASLERMCGALSWPEYNPVSPGVS